MLRRSPLLAYFYIAKLVDTVEYEGLMSPETKRQHKDEWLPVWLYILKKDVEEDSGEEGKSRDEQARNWYW